MWEGGGGGGGGGGVHRSVAYQNRPFVRFSLLSSEKLTENMNDSLFFFFYKGQHVQISVV